MARMFSSCFFQRGGSQCSVFSCGTLPSLSYSTFSCLLLRLCEDRVGASVSGALPESAPEAKHNTWWQCRFARQKMLIKLVPYTFHCYIQWLLMIDRRSTVSNGQPDTFYGGYSLHLLKNKLKAQIVTHYSHRCAVFSGLVISINITWDLRLLLLQFHHRRRRNQIVFLGLNGEFGLERGCTFMGRILSPSSSDNRSALREIMRRHYETLVFPLGPRAPVEASDWREVSVAFVVGCLPRCKEKNRLCDSTPSYTYKKIVIYFLYFHTWMHIPWQLINSLKNLLHLPLEL